MKLVPLIRLVLHFQLSSSIRSHKILLIIHTTYMELRKSMLSDHSSYLKSTNLQYLLVRRLYHKISINPGKMQDKIHLETQRKIHKLKFKPIRLLPCKYLWPRDTVQLNHASKRRNSQVPPTNLLTRRSEFFTHALIIIASAKMRVLSL